LVVLRAHDGRPIDDDVDWPLTTFECFHHEKARTVDGGVLFDVTAERANRCPKERPRRAGMPVGWIDLNGDEHALMIQVVQFSRIAPPDWLHAAGGGHLPPLAR